MKSPAVLQRFQVGPTLQLGGICAPPLFFSLCLQTATSGFHAQYVRFLSVFIGSDVVHLHIHALSPLLFTSESPSASPLCILSRPPPPALLPVLLPSRRPECDAVGVHGFEGDREVHAGFLRSEGWHPRSVSVSPSFILSFSVMSSLPIPSATLQMNRPTS